MAIPAAIRLPARPSDLTGWAPNLLSHDGTGYRKFQLAPAENGGWIDHFDGDGNYPEQSGVGNTTIAPWTARCEDAGDSIAHTGDTMITCDFTRRTGAASRFYKALGGSLNPAGQDSIIRARVRIKSTSDNAGLILIGWFDNANEPDLNADQWGMRLQESAGSGYIIGGGVDQAGVIRFNLNVQVNLDTWYWAELIRDDSSGFIVLTVYSGDDDRTLIASTVVGFAAGLGTWSMDSLGISGYGGSGTADTIADIDSLEARVTTYAVPTDQPVETFQERDSGAANTVWDMSGIDLDGTNKEFSYAYGNSPSPTNWSAYLSLTNLKAEGDPAGRYWRLRSRPTTTDGTTQVYLTEGTIPATPAAAPQLATPTSPAASDPGTDGDLDVTWTNAGSYAATDSVVIHWYRLTPLPEKWVPIGGGGAAEGSTRTSGLPNDGVRQLRIKAVGTGKTDSAWSGNFSGTPTKASPPSTAPIIE